MGKIGDSEIDFVAVRQNEKIYVQVTQEINSEKTEKREYSRLLEIPDNYPKFVLTTDEFAGGNYEGIQDNAHSGFPAQCGVLTSNTR
ncbi:MAG: hypothetical protein ACLU9S_03145 [Oscillospiraceae bacterium]